MSRCRAVLLACACVLGAAGCHRRAATDADCTALFDRIFTLEFRDAGFRDPALEARRRRELFAKLAPVVQSCRGAPLRSGAIACAANAQTVEDLAHRCLR